MTGPSPAVDLLLPGDLLEREAMDLVAESLAPLFEKAAGHTGAIFVVSSNAGAQTALQFWRNAQRDGVAFVSPELFPWCLANATCGFLARRFGITGPNATLMGGDDALEAAWTTARLMLSNRRAEEAFIVAVDFGTEPSHPGRIRGWRLSEGSVALQSSVNTLSTP